MRVAIPHNLEREEVRRRLQSEGHRIGEFVPGGLARVSTDWPHDNRMDLNVSAMGQSVDAQVEIEDNQVVLTAQLPPALAFIEPIVASTVRDQGEKLLEPPKDD